MKNRNDLKSRLFDAYRYIEQRYSEDMNLSQIAAQSFLSDFHFHRLFKAQFQISPKELQAAIRNERAVHLLKHTNFSIADISYEVGFTNPETMIRSFKKYFGSTPGAIRKHQNMPVHTAISETDSKTGQAHRIHKKHKDQMDLVCLRYEGNIQKINRSVERLIDFALTKRIYKQQPFIARFLDIPGNEQAKLRRIEIGIEIPEKVKNRSEFDLNYPFYVARFNSGFYLSTLHRGNPQSLESTYIALYKRILMKNEIPLANQMPWEIYKRIPPFYPPEKSEIEILIPLEY